MEVLNQVSEENYTLYHADCVEVSKELPENSVDFSVFSPPFASLYTYSNSDRDMGNCKDDTEFFDQFQYLIENLHNIMKPGRIVAVHCMNLPTSKQNDGFIGIRDFRGDLIRAFQKQGFIFHSEVVIWKDPVIAMQRTKALGLLHKQVKKDSAMSRMGIPDSMVMFRKAGVNPSPVEGEFKYYVGDKCLNNFAEFERTDGSTVQTPKNEDGTSIDVWQNYASPIWDDINQSDTLQFRTARHSDDERHICPLQLQVIERCLQLWSKPGDVVFSPFMGISSEGYCAVKSGRKFIGTELKESYFNLAVRNMEQASQSQYDLFGES